MRHKLLIIGGGAAGLIAAVTAKDLGADVAIIEGNDRIGKKILTTGNGRCNITNEAADASTGWRYHSSNGSFPLAALRQFTVQQTVDFFAMLGLPLVTLEEGKMYPQSLQASSVIDIFRLAIEERGIPIYYGHKATRISPVKKGFVIDCQVEGTEARYECDKVILCSGGITAPKTGSDGSGYELARQLGHHIIAPVPALVQLKLDYHQLKALSGIKFEGVAQIFVNGQASGLEAGEILFTDYGISGPPILQLSRKASYHLSQHDTVTLSIDMRPEQNQAEMEQFLETHWGMFGHRSLSDSLIGVINKKMIPILLKEAGVDHIHKPCWEITWQEKKGIYHLLKQWEFKVIGTNSFTNAQVTAGGVDTTEVDEQTLESKRVPGLYLAGEVLDVDGDCGGFNLQWAWSSGYTAAFASTKA